MLAISTLDIQIPNLRFGVWGTFWGPNTFLGCLDLNIQVNNHLIYPIVYLLFAVIFGIFGSLASPFRRKESGKSGNVDPELPPKWYLDVLIAVRDLQIAPFQSPALFSRKSTKTINAEGCLLELLMK